MISSAYFSPDRIYRYDLWRTWEGGDGYAMFICLNPSTADEQKDDPTIRRCINFAKAWGYRALCMTNLFAFRATEPEDMKKARDPIGPENDAVLCSCAAAAGVIVAAWGTHGKYRGRDREVRHLLPHPLSYLRLTKNGLPAHPLYLPANLAPTEWGKL